MTAPRAAARALFLAGAMASLAATAGANGWELEDLFYNSDQPSRIIFPNETMLYMGSFTVQITYQATFGNEFLTGITIVNFGTATAADISTVYWRAYCNKTDTGIVPLTYAGMYMEGDVTLGAQTARPAWTWAGVTGQFNACADACGCSPACCGPSLTIELYANIAPCATQGVTVDLGVPFNNLSTTSWGGALSDSEDTFTAWSDVDRGGAFDTVEWMFKEANPSDFITPGDTIAYTVYYGRPGANPLSNIVITDTLPAYTHYIPGSGVPAPDPGWDPNPGPPLVLRWTIPPPLPVLGGVTNTITYQVTADWGNGEAFEPGSGDIAAPEGARLSNQAQGAFLGTTCGVTTTVTQPVSTVVRRFLFWELTDNDMLFAAAFGQPPDGLTYSLFVQNMSTTKTWWNVNIWDTVPAQVDAWCTGCGFNDPCSGWTISPSGCAAYSPGQKQSGGGNTVLTWRLDLPPAFTLAVQWKGLVKGTAAVGGTAINIASIKEDGRTGIVGGTGNSGAPRRFTHLALIVLRTTYVSYVGYAGNCTCNNKCAASGFHIDFFPLNQQAQIELYGIEYQGAGWATTGGVSQSIGCLIGDCLSGFPGAATCALGSGAISGGGSAGCKVERIPARYQPAAWQGACPTFPFDFIYKIVSNAPMVWQLQTVQPACNMDWSIFSPGSTMSFQGFKLYTWMPELADQNALIMINTGMDSQGTYNPAQTTSAFLFRFNFGTLAWDYKYSYDIGPESEVTQMFLNANGDVNPWMVISSDTGMLVYGSWNFLNTAGCCGKAGSDNGGTISPTRETGLTVGGAPSNFYNVAIGTQCGGGVIRQVIGSAGPGPSTVRIWNYTPNNTINILAGQAPNAGAGSTVPSLLRDSNGTWSPNAPIVVGGGLPVAANNPLIFGKSFNGFGPFERGGSNLFKVEVTAGGPIQVLSGTDLYGQWGGGNIMHSPLGPGGAPGPFGTQFWINYGGGDSDSCGIPFVNWFTPKGGQAIQGVTSDGFSAVYTTNGADQCVAFLNFTYLAANLRRNMKFDLIAGGSAMLGLYNQCSLVEKGYTAPFLSAGVHYTIIAPPVVFAGQNFWITIVVESGLGGTQTDYCGTTSFTSTDPAALLAGTGMDTYNYTWSSSVGSCGSSPFDNGVKMFVNVTLSRLGVQTIVAADTVDGSITGLGVVLVVGADVKLSKLPPLSIAASGDTVQFRICWSNYSSASAFTFVVSDAVPVGTVYVPDAATAMNCGNTDGTPVDVAYSLATSATIPPPASFVAIAGATAPPAGTRWLRWTAFVAGVQTTGCFCYRVSVQ